MWFKFVESAHIKDVLAHLRVISSPHDRISWYRILLLIEKIGPAGVPIVLSKIVEEGLLKDGQRVALMGIGSGLNCTVGEVIW